MPHNDPNTLLLGEMRGQLRELVHTVNNLSVKFDSLSRDVIGLGLLAGEITDMKVRMSAVLERVDSLEGSESRRAGATSVISVIMKSPTLGWLVGAAVTAWAILTRKVHL